jgi:F0F1-type ATP synthase membrane subunit b/b'
MFGQHVNQLLYYFWILLTCLIVLIPLVILCFTGWKKTKKFVNKKAQMIKENSEMRHIKSDLEQQKEEFINTSEY